MKQKHTTTTQLYIVQMAHIPPTVQNWPNLFCDATLRPFSKVVILVSYCSLPSTEANTGLGMPGKGVDKEILGYPLALLYCLQAAMPNLQQ